MLLRPEAQFDLAVRLREGGATLGEAFAFLSGLYFRGKLAYARAFANGAAFVITPNAGLLPVDTIVTTETLRGFAAVDIHHEDDRFTKPLERDAKKIARALPDAEIVLLGSIASQKYVDVLGRIFGERLLFPIDFVGRGDMSRGGLLLRAAHAGEELAYEPVLKAKRHGARPPRLERVPGILKAAIEREKALRATAPSSERASPQKRRGTTRARPPR